MEGEQMGFYVPPELRAIGTVDEKPLSCPDCGSQQLVFSGMALTSGYTQVGFDSRDPGTLRHGEITKPPGVLSASVELLCNNGHCFSFIIALDWEYNGGVTIGTLSAKDGISQEEQEVALIKLEQREAQEAQEREGKLG